MSVNIHISQWKDANGTPIDFFSIECIDCDKFINFSSKERINRISGGHKAWHTRNDRQ